MANTDEVERVATAIAELVGSPVFGPLHDTAEHQATRDEFRRLATVAIEVAAYRQSPT